MGIPHSYPGHWVNGGVFFIIFFYLFKMGILESSVFGVTAYVISSESCQRRLKPEQAKLPTTRNSQNVANAALQKKKTGEIAKSPEGMVSLAFLASIFVNC